jgi:hypothetical protein
MERYDDTEQWHERLALKLQLWFFDVEDVKDDGERVEKLFLDTYRREIWFRKELFAYVTEQQSALDEQDADEEEEVYASLIGDVEDISKEDMDKDLTNWLEGWKERENKREMNARFDLLVAYLSLVVTYVSLAVTCWVSG